MKNQSPSIGLALGGGAVLGAAHIGVLRALEEHKIRPTHISGTSIGAFVGALYAFGTSVDDLESIALEMDWLQLTNFKLSKMGLLSNEKIGKRIQDRIGRVRIEESDIPLAVVATDISTGEKVILREGVLFKAVMASSCLPGIFIPIEWEGRLLVDGFLCENVPVEPLEEMGTDRIVAVDLTSNRSFKRPNDIIDLLSNTFDIGFRNMITREFDPGTTIVIQPELSGYSKTNTRKTRELIKAGYNAAIQTLNEQSDRLS
ncbi:MAG: patatin-like phospholipase family protein [Bacteroidota bacterium]